MKPKEHRPLGAIEPRCPYVDPHTVVGHALSSGERSLRLRRLIAVFDRILNTRPFRWRCGRHEAQRSRRGRGIAHTLEDVNAIVGHDTANSSLGRFDNWI